MSANTLQNNEALLGSARITSTRFAALLRDATQGKSTSRSRAHRAFTDLEFGQHRNVRSLFHSVPCCSTHGHSTLFASNQRNCLKVRDQSRTRFLEKIFTLWKTSVQRDSRRFESTLVTSMRVVSNQLILNKSSHSFEGPSRLNSAQFVDTRIFSPRRGAFHLNFLQSRATVGKQYQESVSRHFVATRLLSPQHTSAHVGALLLVSNHLN